jgi:hypothetical protein
MKIRTQRAGFTLVEILLSVSISVMVFFAMGILLTKCFSLWKDATANWRLAQYARISRERILCGVTNNVSGGVTNLTGLLSATNAVIASDSGWSSVSYGRIGETGVVYTIRGWPLEADDKHIQLRRGVASWVYAQSSGTAEPEAKIDTFTAVLTNNILTVSYRLQLSAAGKTFMQPHTIQTYLINKED